MTLFVLVLDCFTCCRGLFEMYCAMVCGLKVFFVFGCVLFIRGVGETFVQANLLGGVHH